MDTTAPERLRREQARGHEPLGRWLVDNVPRGTNLAIPRARESRREIPFASGEGRLTPA